MTIEEAAYTTYFQAFILHKGLQVGDKIKTHEYIIWNGQKWREWRKLNNVPWNHPVTAEHAEAFGKWLFETIPA
jgi:hypothetical protein